MAYNPRTTAHRSGDKLRAATVEQSIAILLPEGYVDNTNSVDKMDFTIDDIHVEVKAKHTKYNASNWTFPSGVPEVDVFMMDELSIRKGLMFYPHVYYVMYDEPTKRLFACNIAQLVCCDRVTMNRFSGAINKGKWLFDINQFFQINDRSDLWSLIQLWEQNKPWSKSEALAPTSDK